MRKLLMTFFLLTILGANVHAQSGFHVGLGKAVAKQGSELLKQVVDADHTPSPGDTVPNQMDACTSTPPFSVAPVDLAQVAAINPLGNVSPSPHTFPSDHIYYYMKPLDPLNPTGTRVTATLYAPGDIRISEVLSSEITSVNPHVTDYGVYFYACRELKSWFAHVVTLDDAITSHLGGTSQTCTDYSSGPSTTFHSCIESTNFSIPAGIAIGTVGGFRASFDFGSYDYRRTPLAYVSPLRHGPDQPYDACPIDYFGSTLKSQMDAMLGLYDGSFPRTIAPVCGSILYDVVNTASGFWFKPGKPDRPEDPHLSLIHSNVFADEEVISVGDSVQNLGPTFLIFVPTTSGFVNRDIAQVISDGNMYCYDSFRDPNNNPGSPGYSVLLTMPTSTTLRIGPLNAPSCGTGPWSFTTYTEFQR